MEKFDFINNNNNNNNDDDNTYSFPVLLCDENGYSLDNENQIQTGSSFPVINAELCEGEEFLFYPSAAASFHLDTDNNNFFIDSATSIYQHNCDENEPNIFDLNFPPIALPIACVNELPVTAALLHTDTEARVLSTLAAANESKEDDEKEFEIASCEYYKETATSPTAFPPSAQQAKANRLRAMVRWLAKKKRQSKTGRPQNSLNLARRAATAKRERENGKFKRNKLWISLTSWDDFQQSKQPAEPNV